MNSAIAWQMTAADFLKLRKRVSTLAFSLAFAVLPLIIFFAVRAAQHSSNAVKYEAAGGVHGFTDGLRILALFMGPLAAILIGAEAGAGDAASGVFRDLVVTGRSRLALFATRVPAAIALCFSIITGAYVLVLTGTFAFASGAPTPSTTLILNGLGFTLLSNGVLCAVAVGVASLTASRPGAITALIGWQLVVSPIIANISSLGGVRHVVLSQALAHFSPVRAGDRVLVLYSTGGALVCVLAWLAVFLALGAWRTRTMDA